jgi:MoaA/NifB/PqqE/SkfB family radical SAM enzyme
MPDFSEAANISYLRRFLEHQSSVLDVAEGRPTQSLYLQQPTRCFTPYLFTLIDPQGDVYPCCFLFEDNQGYTPEAVEKRKAHCVGHLKDETFVGIWNGTKYQQVRRELASINPKREKYAACGECTRHCNHNRGLSQLYAEYSGLKATARGADSVLEGIVGERTQNEVWL